MAIKRSAEMPQSLHVTRGLGPFRAGSAISSRLVGRSITALVVWRFAASAVVSLSSQRASECRVCLS
jgi:hypothetical protein